MIPAPTSPQLFRTDPLTGVGNLLGFVDWLAEMRAPQALCSHSLITIDLNGLSQLNHVDRALGDAALRRVGLVLREEVEAPIFRIGGDEFVLVLSEPPLFSHVACAERIFARLNSEALDFAMRTPVASVAVLHYTGAERADPAEVLGQLQAALRQQELRGRDQVREFYAPEMQADPDLRHVVNDLVDRLALLGSMLDEAQRLAYSDPVSGLPNMRAALQQLDAALQHASDNGEPLAILLIDGDDLRRYNKISYAAGDDMIQRIGAVLHEQIRSGDMLARWRVGDEFLVLLPSTPHATAVMIGERLCRAVERASSEWPIPVTISIGVALYPDHGSSVESLLRRAEAANARAKMLGKNRVQVAG